MYYVYLGGELAFDALLDSPAVTSARLSQSVNAAAYLDLTLVPGASPAEGQEAEVRWDATTLFRGRVTEVSQGADGLWDVSCVSDVDLLNDVLVPPHSTDGTVGSKCPDTLSGYVQWLAETFNARMVAGFRVDVGQNQADLLRDGALSLTDDSWPSVAAALEDHVLSVGGYVDWEPHADSGTLNVWSDIHEAAGQLVDLGQNVTDITVTRTTEGRATAIVPWSGAGDEPVTLDGATEAEAALVRNAGMCLANGAIYDPEAAAEWGYREERVELSGVADRADLVRAAIARLRTMEGPQLTVQCHAVDMALYREGYAHLRVGQAVRVRAVPLGVDEYLAVQGMDLDLMDPANTSYTLGVTYDTLTGQQSAFLRGLNGSINHALDKADQAGKDAADALDKADQAGKDAADALDKADQAGKDAAGSLDKADQAAKDAADALERADQTADEAAKGVQEAKDAAAAAGEKADELSKRADEMAGQITDITVTQDQLSTKVEGAVEDAGAALKASSEVTQTVSGLKVDVQQSLTDSGTALEKATSAEVTANGLETKVTQAYESSTEALTKSAEAKQTADGLSATISKDYVSKEDAEKTYSTKAELSATSTSLTSKITETAKTAQAAQDKATEVEQTASGLSATITEVSKVASSASSKADAASTEAGEAKDAAEGAVTKATEAKATADGLSASVTKAQDTADSAVKAASTAQQTATEVKTTVETDYLKKADAESTYASKSSLTQTADSIRAEVTEAVTTANGAMEKATEAKQTADGLSATISRDYVSKEDAGKTYATKAELTATSDSIRTEVSETYVTKEGADATYAAKSYVDQTADSITSQVSKTYVSKTDASSTYATKTQLKQTSDSITSTVEDVKTVADSAYSKASSVEQTADGLTVRLTTAEGDIKDAQDAASSAQTTANAAKTTASSASSAASSASSKASAAQSAADKAQDAADSAQSTANSAKTAASDAAKTATNYLKFDSSGLCVGNMSGTLGYNALITGSAYQIRNGSTVLSSFNASKIELGKNSTSSSISMCGGKGSISYKDGNISVGMASSDSQMALGGSSVILRGTKTIVGDSASSIAETSVYGNKLHLGNRSAGSHAIQNVFVGSKACDNWDGNDVQVLSPSDIASLCGREYKEGDTLLVANGDARANKSYNPVSAEYWSSSGWWVPCGPSGSGGSGTIRINYVLFAVA